MTPRLRLRWAGRGIDVSDSALVDPNWLPRKAAAAAMVTARLWCETASVVLGVSVAAATRWSALAGRDHLDHLDHLDYLAARIDNPPE